MEIPQPFDLKCINKVLLVIDSICIDNSYCSPEVFYNICRSTVYGGRLTNYSFILNVCQKSGFISIQNKQIKLTGKGREYLSLNPLQNFELTSSQKDYLVLHLFFDGPWKSPTRGLFNNFEPNYDDITFHKELNSFTSSYNAIIFVLKYLGVIEEYSGYLIVTPLYVKYIVKIRAHGKGVTPQELAAALQANQTMGLLAEESVVAYERRRLKAMGREIEAGMVRRISQLDVGAGYDIQSFNGDKPKLEYDRFIEVKASQKNLLSFYISSNELKIAKEKGDCYWIYFIGNFSAKNQDKIQPIMIQNPQKRIYEIDQIDIEVSVLKITQKDNLPIVECNNNGIRGLLL